MVFNERGLFDIWVNLALDPQFILVRLSNHARTGSWNEPVLSNEGNVVVYILQSKQPKAPICFRVPELQTSRITVSNNSCITNMWNRNSTNMYSNTNITMWLSTLCNVVNNHTAVMIYWDTPYTVRNTSLFKRLLWLYLETEAI